MKQRLYIDTSVFGGYFDEEFSEFTRPLFERLWSGEFRLLFSAVPQDELSFAPGDHPETLWPMKTTAKKAFDAVKFMREQRDILSEKLSKMTKEEIVEYFKRKKLESSTKPSA